MNYSPLFLVLCTVSSLIFHLNCQYVGTPASKDDIKAFLKHSVDLKCEYTGSGPVEFMDWYRNNSLVKEEKPGHYVVRSKSNESTLSIKIFVESDQNFTQWYVKTKRNNVEEQPLECQFGQILLKPSPQSIETNKANEQIDSDHGSVRRNEDESLILKCIVKPLREPSYANPLEWKFSKDDLTFTRLNSNDNGIVVKDDQLEFTTVKKVHRGYYRCELNGVNFTVLLRVKDRLAALWPFLGIVGVVLVLVIVILIFEKRQKSNKKTTATDEDEQDQRTDLLARTTTKSSDNDNKKRTVNA